MTRTRLAVCVLILAATPVWAQPPAPPPTAPAAAGEPTLPPELRLERDNLLLTARVNELETQIAQLRAQLVNAQIAEKAPGMIAKLQAAAPGFDVNPNTLQLTPKAPAPVAAAPPTVPPPAPQPVAPQQPRPD